MPWLLFALLAGWLGRGEGALRTDLVLTATGGGLPFDLHLPIVGDCVGNACCIHPSSTISARHWTRAEAEALMPDATATCPVKGTLPCDIPLSESSYDAGFPFSQMPLYTVSSGRYCGDTDPVLLTLDEPTTSVGGAPDLIRFFGESAVPYSFMSGVPRPDLVQLVFQLTAIQIRIKTGVVSSTKRMEADEKLHVREAVLFSGVTLTLSGSIFPQE